jgi:hypothetical protein
MFASDRDTCRAEPVALPQKGVIEDGFDGFGDRRGRMRSAAQDRSAETTSFCLLAPDKRHELKRPRQGGAAESGS